MNATDSPNVPEGQSPSTLNRLEDGPFRFWSHNLGVYCFGTWGCRVTHGSRVVWNDPSNNWNSPFAERAPGMRERMRGNQGLFKNADGPLIVEWLDSERVPRRAVVDLPRLLADGMIPHSIPSEQIRAGVSVSPPDVIVEVDDRAIRLHLVSHIPLKAPRDPSRPLSNVAVEWTQIFEDRDVERAR